MQHVVDEHRLVASDAEQAALSEGGGEAHRLQHVGETRLDACLELRHRQLTTGVGRRPQLGSHVGEASGDVVEAPGVGQDDLESQSADQRLARSHPAVTGADATTITVSAVRTGTRRTIPGNLLPASNRGANE